MQPIQMLLSQNQKIFSEPFSEFPKSTSNLEYSGKRHEHRNFFVSEIITAKSGVT